MATLRRWLAVLRIPLALLGVALFFTFYNRFLLDAHLRNLRASLSVLDAATGVGRAEAALLLVDQTLLAQAAGEEPDLQGLSVLQYAQGTLASDDPMRRVEDAQAMVAILGQDRAAGRPGLLGAMDAMVTGVQSTLQKAGLASSQLFSGPITPDIDATKLGKAQRLERLCRFPEAAVLYEELLSGYPHYVGRAGLHLRLGHAYERAQDFNQAEQHYRSALQRGQTLPEAAVSGQMLQGLAAARQKQAQISRLERALAASLEGTERQRAAHELGSTLMQASAMDRAAAAFRQAFAAEPGGELALASLFKEAWCFRVAGRFEETANRFHELIQKYPKSTWATASYMQVAEIHRASGDSAAAAHAYEQAIAEDKDPALEAVAHALAASTYWLDLKDPVKASLHFRDLEKGFPASPFSPTRRMIEEAMRRKGYPPPPLGERPLGVPAPPAPVKVAPVEGLETSLVAGSPLMNWLEGFLPVFVDVFSDSLAKYMRAAGEMQLTRRFSEVEFRDLVVRQVQRRFPGQVADIQTQILPGSFVGSGTVKLGILRFKVEARIGIRVVDEKPNAALQKIKVGRIAVPERLVKYLEKRVNSVIQQADYPLRVKSYELHEGYALISVELVETPRQPLEW